jgi:hypothetical protein
MYKIVEQQLVGHGESLRFLGNANQCRFCNTIAPSDFGKKRNAHAFPEGLGNKSLFLLNECKSCNSKFSLYEDALCKAVGPFLTLGGVRGKKGVRQTGRSDSESVLKHQIRNGKRHMSIGVKGLDYRNPRILHKSANHYLKFPVKGDRFVPRYAYKSLLKIALSILPENDLALYRSSLTCLQKEDSLPKDCSPQVWFSHASIGNAPPTLACVVLQRTSEIHLVPYTIAFFLAGSVCFQICLRSEHKDSHIPIAGSFDLRWKTALAKPEGGHHFIEYSEPYEFNWGSLEPRLQPIEAFELTVATNTHEGKFSPIFREI